MKAVVKDLSLELNPDLVEVYKEKALYNAEEINSNDTHVYK